MPLLFVLLAGCLSLARIAGFVHVTSNNVPFRAAITRGALGCCHRC